MTHDSGWPPAARSAAPVMRLIPSMSLVLFAPSLPLLYKRIIKGSDGGRGVRPDPGHRAPGRCRM